MVRSSFIGSSGQNKLQTIAMYSCSLYFAAPAILLCWFYALIWLIFPLTTLAMGLYLYWIHNGDDSPVTGSRRPFMRGLTWWWSHACDYFPILLVKTVDLDPNKKYIFGYHPHGIISVGAFGAFATDGARILSLSGTVLQPTERGFSALFPGIDRRLVTLPINFNTPFLREYILSLGCCDSSRETFRNVLNRGSAIVVVVGGAAESMLVRPGEIELVLEKRRGFVREAIKANACLVPIIAYGENDVYRVYHPNDTSWIARFQRTVKRYTGIGVPIFEGRSILFKDFGLMPDRRPIVIVVGAPIEPPPLSDAQRASFQPKLDRQTDVPLNEDGKLLEEHHAKYVQALQDLYREYKKATWNQAGRSMHGSLRLQKMK